MHFVGGHAETTTHAAAVKAETNGYLSPFQKALTRCTHPIVYQGAAARQATATARCKVISIAEGEELGDENNR